MGQEKAYRDLYQGAILSCIEVFMIQRRGKEGTMADQQVILAVNDVPIVLNNFVQNYIDQVVSGILASLRGTAEIESIELSIEGNQVSVVLNDAAVPLNPFVTRIIRSTMLGMVSSLKGVGTVDKMQLFITRER
jgi:hypothetical protein